MAAARYIVRVFDGRGSVHAGTFQDLDRAIAKADHCAQVARKLGKNVSCSVRHLEPGARATKTLIGSLGSRVAEKGVYSTNSLGGRRDGE